MRITITSQLRTGDKPDEFNGMMEVLVHHKNGGVDKFRMTSYHFYEALRVYCESLKKDAEAKFPKITK